MGANLVVFYAFATVAVVSTLFVIAQPNTVYSVLLLIASFLALAGLYVLLDAPFVAVTQIIVYAGAIMVLFLFVVMLLNVPREEAGPERAVSSAAARWFGVVLAMAMAIELVWALEVSRTLEGDRLAREAGVTWSVAQIGQILFTEYAFAFEATSVLILVAMVGAISLAGRHLTARWPGREAGASHWRR